MTDIQTRPFSKNYSGLLNQSVIAISIAVICVTSHEIMKRRRRGKHYKRSPQEGLGSIESWEFGYLFQGRSWAMNPSPPAPQGFPLSWVKESITFPEDKMLELRGIDATLYVRWLRACRWFVLLHTLTTVPILLPIHVKFSGDSVPSRSMTRASISSLVLTPQGFGLSLLWIHICLLFWITLTWIGTLLWICHGAFYFRARTIEKLAKRTESATATEKDLQYHPPPHPQYPFRDVPAEFDNDPSNLGLKLRTIMVENLLPHLRDEENLKEYFKCYIPRPIDKSSVGITSSMQPGFFNKSLAFLFNRVKRIQNPLPVVNAVRDDAVDHKDQEEGIDADSVPVVIDRVVIVRKMTKLASLLQRREEVLRNLETAHIKLARKTLIAVKDAVEKRHVAQPARPGTLSQVSLATPNFPGTQIMTPDVEPGRQNQDGPVEIEEQMDILIRTLSPYVDNFGLRQDTRLVRIGKAIAAASRQVLRMIHVQILHYSDNDLAPASNHASRAIQDYPFSSQRNHRKTVWEALLNLPRSSLHPYQPLISLSKLFRGKTVPSIDYFTAKLKLLTSLITDERSKAVNSFQPVSTAFVTFADASDARRACKYLAVHPNNPLACLVTMAPDYEDLDWIRVMKSTLKAEFVKDWVVGVGVWAFTIFWLFPVSLLVGLVSVQSISQFWPGLKSYLDHHPWEEEIIQSFVPTLLVALLALLIPLILLLIAKKAQTIPTLSAMHDRIMTRYYKFLIVNVLVFFCVGTAAVQTVLQSFKKVLGDDSILQIVATSFPTAGPFYVGWLIFTTALHGGLELALFGLPLIMYPSTKRQVTPRKRAVGIRPRTFNFYYWLPNHMLIVHILLLFAILNPLVIPFGLLYFCVEAAVVKNQLLHVYAKNYEGNGRVILIRLVRYSLDGLILSQTVFLIYMVVLKKKTVNVALAAVLILFTAIVKIMMTRLCRAQYEDDDIAEANVVCNGHSSDFASNVDFTNGEAMRIDPHDRTMARLTQKFRRLRLPAWINFSYQTVPHRAHALRRKPIPFGPFSRLGSLDNPNSTEESVPPDVETVLSIPIQASPITDGHPISESIPPLSGPVNSHPPLVAWNDESRVNTPYDNPFYTKAINDSLWLPRDPFGILDLDDTVTLRVSLTSEPSAGQLGMWHEEVSSPLPNLPLSSPSSLPPAGFATSIAASDDRHSTLISTPVQQYSGEEDIKLPPAIAARVADLENEDDVQKALTDRPPSLFARRKSSAKDKEGLTATSRRPGSRRGTIDDDNRPPMRFRSGSSYSYSGEQDSRGTSFWSAVGQQRDRSASVATGGTSQRSPALPPAASASKLTVVVPNSPDLPQLLASRTEVSTTKQVTTHEAVINEVIAEEQEAAHEHSKEEQADAERAKSKKSWMTAWIYNRIH